MTNETDIQESNTDETANEDESDNNLFYQVAIAICVLTMGSGVFKYLVTFVAGTGDAANNRLMYGISSVLVAVGFVGAIVLLALMRIEQKLDSLQCDVNDLFDNEEDADEPVVSES